jgi:2-methylisocitrate lyase-like PEP mutase family enzyme
LSSIKEKAIQFRNLHRSGHILILPNAWDVVSARIFEELGIQAIATSSGGISSSLGYPDGQNISMVEMLRVVERISRSVALPVSADMEAGYGNKWEEMEVMARGVISAGAVGLNIEDATRRIQRPLSEIGEMTNKIRAIRKVSKLTDIPLFINARTDAYRLDGDEEQKIKSTIERGKAYLDAGADCVFPFGLKSTEGISKVVRELDGHVNIIAGPGSLPIPQLEKLGVERVSFGTGTIRSTIGTLQKIVEELKESGTYDSIKSLAITHEELNQLASPRRSS